MGKRRRKPSKTSVEVLNAERQWTMQPSVVAYDIEAAKARNRRTLASYAALARVEDGVSRPVVHTATGRRWGDETAGFGTGAEHRGGLLQQQCVNTTLGIPARGTTSSPPGSIDGIAGSSTVTHVLSELGFLP